MSRQQMLIKLKIKKELCGLGLCKEKLKAHSILQSLKAAKKSAEEAGAHQRWIQKKLEKTSSLSE